LHEAIDYKILSEQIYFGLFVQFDLLLMNNISLIAGFPKTLLASESLNFHILCIFSKKSLLASDNCNLHRVFFF